MFALDQPSAIKQVNLLRGGNSNVTTIPFLRGNTVSLFNDSSLAAATPNRDAAVGNTKETYYFVTVKSGWELQNFGRII